MDARRLSRIFRKSAISSTRHSDPRNWRNNYPNPAFELHNPGDAFWAAKKVMAFSDDAIRAIVSTAQYSDPRATEWLVKCLIERRDKIGRAFFEDLLPLDGFAVSGGKFSFDDLAAYYGFRKAASILGAMVRIRQSHRRAHAHPFGRDFRRSARLRRHISQRRFKRENPAEDRDSLRTRRLRRGNRSYW